MIRPVVVTWDLDKVFLCTLKIDKRKKSRLQMNCDYVSVSVDRPTRMQLSGQLCFPTANETRTSEQ